MITIFCDFCPLPNEKIGDVMIQILQKIAKNANFLHFFQKIFYKSKHRSQEFFRGDEKTKINLTRNFYIQAVQMNA
jgi:hypothetical protein